MDLLFLLLILARMEADADLLAAYRAARQRLISDPRLADWVGVLMPDATTASVIDYERLLTAPVVDLLARCLSQDDLETLMRDTKGLTRREPQPGDRGQPEPGRRGA